MGNFKVSGHAKEEEMKAKTITTNGVELMLVEVPELAIVNDIFLTKNFKPNSTELDDNSFCTLLNVLNKDRTLLHNVVLDKESKLKFSIIGTITSGKIDFDCEGLVKEIHPEGVYEDYMQNEEGFYDSKKSFLSLLEANGVTVKNQIEKPTDMYRGEQYYGAEMDKWQDAEKSIWKKIVVLKINKP